MRDGATDDVIVILPCTARKRAGRWQATLLYNTTVFRERLMWARSVVAEHRIFILSAKYGLLHTTDLTETYDVRFGQKGAIGVDAIRKQADLLGIRDASAVLLGAGIYRDIARQIWSDLRLPLDKLPGNGEQINWLRANHGRLN